ncbi:hypothetical protein ACO0QE_000723 [Hanseniaspora vineae]
MDQLVIQETDYDAFSCKTAAMMKHYLPDALIEESLPSYNDVYMDYIPSLQAVMLKEQQHQKQQESQGENAKSLSSQNGQLGSFASQQRDDLRAKRYFQKFNRKCSTAKKPSRLNSSASSPFHQQNFDSPGFSHSGDMGRNQSSPIMNIGTYLRTICIDHLLLEKFDILHMPNVQVINLGCGSDLRYFQYRSSVQFHKYLDIDFADSVKMKTKILKSDNPLYKQTENDSHIYKLVPMNLNNGSEFENLVHQEINPDFPLVVISECCFCYMEDKKVDDLIQIINSTYNQNKQMLHWVCYDPISGKDTKFGEIMYQNLLMTRNLKMHTLLQYNSLQRYQERFHLPQELMHGSTMWDMYTHLEKGEKIRLSQCEFLDELEELKIILTHYIIVYT